jgi:hypothetical protein
MFTSGSEEVVERDTSPDVVLSNTLGDGIDIEVYDSATATLLMTIPGGTSAAVPKILENGQPAPATGNSPLAHIPLAVDVWFTGKFGEERMPLYHLPFNINKPRTFNLQPRPFTALPSSSLSPALMALAMKSASTSASVSASAGAGTGTGTGTGTQSRQPSSSSTSTSTTFPTGSPPRKAILLEPIIEEAFENCRYDPITGRYRIV